MPLLDHPEFTAFADGSIANPRGKILYQWRERRGLRVKIRNRSLSVPLVILTAFTGRPPFDGWVPRQLDQDPWNTHIDNLVWASTHTVPYRGTKRIATGSGMPDDWSGWPTQDHWDAYTNF